MTATHSNHTVYNVNYHFVWCPKYRHSFRSKIEEPLAASFRTICEEYDYEIETLHIAPDHIHLFLSAHPKHAPVKSSGRSRASPPGRCGSSTNR